MTKSHPTQQSQKSRATRERILDAAGELFADKPAATIGMHEIASAAGCSRATLYRYFPGKQALLAMKIWEEQTNAKGQGPLTDPTLDYQRDASGSAAGVIHSR